MVAPAFSLPAAGNGAFRYLKLREAGYFAVIAGAGNSGGRFGSPRAPRTSNSSNSNDGATTDAGKPFCAEPNAPSAVPANPATCVCM